jgi:hypothetical protein
MMAFYYALLTVNRRPDPFTVNASWKNSFKVSQPQRLRPDSSFLSYRKYLRRIFGMLKTKWRWGTALSTSSQSHSPNSTTLF